MKILNKTLVIDVLISFLELVLKSGLHVRFLIVNKTMN